MFDQLLRELSNRFHFSGDNAVALLQLLVGYLTSDQTGGITGFLGRMSAAGLGGVAQTWVGNKGSSAQPLASSELESVLTGPSGENLIDAATQKVGIAREVAGSALSFMLPVVVGKLAPGDAVIPAMPPATQPARAPAVAPVGAAPQRTAAGAAIIAGPPDLSHSVDPYPQTGRPPARFNLIPWLALLLLAAAAWFGWQNRAELMRWAQPMLEKVAGAPASSGESASAAGPAGAASESARTADSPVAAASGTAPSAATDVATAATGGAAATGSAGASATSGAAGSASATGSAGAAGASGPASATGLAAGAPVLVVYFASSRTDVADEYAPKYAAIVARLKDDQGAKAVVAGFSDPSGNVAQNAELSRRRAKAVHDGLVAAGIPAERVVIVEAPLEEPASGVKNAELRRVEVSIGK